MNEGDLLLTCGQPGMIPQPGRDAVGAAVRVDVRAMAAVREHCDALELLVGDDLWPLPKYREMLFPV